MKEKYIKNKRFFPIILGMVAVLAFCCTPIRALFCPHKEVEQIVEIAPTCTEAGKLNIVCTQCNTVIESEAIEPLGHKILTYKITVPASENKDGEQVGTCENCGETFTKPYVCMHSETRTVISVAPTCYEDGVEDVVCEECNTKLRSNPVAKLEHSFSDWAVSIEATPYANGEMYRACKYCGKKETKSYEFSLPTNSIYIPGTGIQTSIYLGEFTQADTNSHDLVYSHPWMFGMGDNDPFVIGHSYRTMGKLPRTQVGQYIYLNVNGCIETYQVAISEYATVTDDEQNMIGSDGTSIFSNLGTKTLHLYTCYGSNRNGRWIVLARLVG